jgi:hypothetical protein
MWAVTFCTFSPATVRLGMSQKPASFKDLEASKLSAVEKPNQINDLHLAN